MINLQRSKGQTAECSGHMKVPVSPARGQTESVQSPKTSKTLAWLQYRLGWTSLENTALSSGICRITSSLWKEFANTINSWIECRFICPINFIFLKLKNVVCLKHLQLFYSPSAANVQVLLCVSILCWVGFILWNNTKVCTLSCPELQMRLKDPFSLKAADMTKRTNKPRKPRDEESSDEVSGKLLSSTRLLGLSLLIWQNPT